jgi:hypothetical protein
MLHNLKLAKTSVLICVLLLLFVVINSLTTAACFSEPVYKSTDNRGVPSYSSKPQTKGAEPAKLPNIAKARFSEAKPDKLTCVGHGGIDCQAGADSDGSVICYDKFKDGIQRFAVSCSAAKLSIIPESSKVIAGKFALVLRNNSAVAAKGIKISAVNNTVLDGPLELEPYGSAEYSSAQPIPRDAKIRIACDNCP